MSVNECVCVRVREHVCMCVPARVCLSACMNMCVCVCVSLCIVSTMFGLSSFFCIVHILTSFTLNYLARGDTTALLFLHSADSADTSQCLSNLHL